MTKRILSIILCTVMLVAVSVFPTSAEATEIDEINLYAYYPIVGQEAIFDIYEIPYTKPYGLMNDTPNGNVLWYDETDGLYLKMGDRFKADHTYRIEVNLESDFPDYTFPLFQDPESGEYFYGVNAYVNGRSADTSPIGKNISDLSRLQTVKISCSMKAREGLISIDSVYVTNVPVPKVGDRPVYAGIMFEEGYAGFGYRIANLTDDSHLNGIGWYDLTEKRYMRKNSENFTKDHEYELRVLLEADSSHCFITDDGLPNVSSYVRGNRAVSSLLNGYDTDRYLYVTYKFGKVVMTSDIIKYVTITDLDAPKVGSIADYSVTIKGSDKYHVSYAIDEDTHNGITWYAEVLDGSMMVNDTFVESKSYAVNIELYCDSDTTFLTDGNGVPLVKATVNGREATCYSMGERKLLVTFFFDAEEKYTYTVSGSVASFGSAADEVTMTLCPAGDTTPVAEKTECGLNVSFSFELTNAGNYVLYITKKNHKPAQAGIIVVENGGTADIVMTLSSDANTDRKVNLADVAMVLKHIAKWDVQLDTYAADVTGDLKVNLADVSLMLKYIAKWDVVLG